MSKYKLNINAPSNAKWSNLSDYVSRFTKEFLEGALKTSVDYTLNQVEKDNEIQIETEGSKYSIALTPTHTPNHSFKLFSNIPGETEVITFEDTTIYNQLLNLKLFDIGVQLKEDLTKSNQVSGNTKSIFVARTNEYQETCREEVIRDLKRNGYAILDPKDTSSKEEIQQLLKQAELSIHIIDVNDPILNVNEENSIVEQQNEIAAKEAEQGKLKRLIWLSPDSKFNNEAQQAVVEQLKRDIEALQGAEFVQTPIEIFKTIIHNKLGTNQRLKYTVHSDFDKNEEKSVYLIYDQSYTNQVKSIESIFEKGNYKIYHPLFKGEQLEIVNKHRQALVNASVVCIYYANGNDAWIKSKLKDVVKAPGFGKTRPYQHKLIVTNAKENLPNMEGYITIEDDNKVVENQLTTAIK